MSKRSVRETAGQLFSAVVGAVGFMVCIAVAAYAIVMALLMADRLFSPAPLYEVVLGAAVVVGLTAIVVCLAVRGAVEIHFGRK